MATIYTCQTSDEVSGLVHHFLSNELLLIMMSLSPRENETEDDQYRRERVASNARERLVGVLYIMMRRMNNLGHAGDASKLEQIMHMVTDCEVLDQNVRETIHAKEKELYPPDPAFAAVVAKINAQ